MQNLPKEKIAALRALMAERGLKAYLIPSSDPHMSEYVPRRWEARQWISGFTGSAGTVAVFAAGAGLWTDSRYFLQAGEQLEGSGIELFRMGLPGVPSLVGFLLDNLEPGDTVGLDGNTYPASAAEDLERKLAERGLSLNTSCDLVGEIWTDRPQLPQGVIFEHPLELAGSSSASKIRAVIEQLNREGADGLLLCALDDIAWTLNIRGSDVPYNPVAVCFAFISDKEKILFIEPGKLTAEIADRLMDDDVTPADYNLAAKFLSSLPAGYSLMLDKNKTNAALFKAIPPGCRVINGITPASHLKSIKSPAELAGFANALIKDGVALTRFYMWLEEAMKKGEPLTETGLAEKLSELRAAQPLYVSDSFPTICGYGAHGAVVHYHATPETDAAIQPQGLLLMDSGAQYQDGTTDITRTIALGPVTEAMRKDFTRVLKGHISLAKCRFPEGTRGSQIDVLARKALWDAGINYLHGTGHGIGYFLNVHEGPQSIRMEENPAPLRPGMVMSNEPAMYRAGEYGIRTENMIAVRVDIETGYGRFLAFDTLTLCYIDSTLVEPSMLSAREQAWLNNYHREVFEKLSPYLSEAEREWLKDKTMPV
ncbi:MAG: aminopeptidase P family protein [Tannerellaceae bacterium]|jgi:Xaa-Pro aminopeptidase|nr:aminopeptidase P family protein [Tannerellaceae bacterium]